MLRDGRALTRLAAIAVALGGCSLLLHTTAAVRKERLWQLEYRIGLDGQRFSMASWRFWDDVGIAISRYLDRLADPLPAEPDPGPMIDAYRVILERRTRDEAILPHQFWRALSPRPFLRNRLGYSVPPLEDPGRPVLIAAAFVALGGISPYLLIWIGTLVAIPLLVWVAWEASEAGYTVAGLCFVLVSVSSCYVVECLSLAHSAVGFYLAALFTLIALTIYATFGRGRSVGGYAIRLFVAAVVFAVCSCARSGTLAMAPAFLLVLILALRRVLAKPTGPKAWLAGIGASLIFLAPYLFVRPVQRHNFWTSFWQGLADFSQRGHSWHDRDLKRFLLRSGQPSFEHPRAVGPEIEGFMRGVVQQEILGDPLWYAGILVKRTLATVALTKLTPWGPRDGFSIQPPLFHYKYVIPIDWWGIGQRRVELPVVCLWLPTVLLFTLLATSGPATRSRLRSYALVLGVLALATLPVPVLVSTAAGMETQAFGFVYFLGLSFLAQETISWARTRFGRRGGDA